MQTNHTNDMVIFAFDGPSDRLLRRGVQIMQQNSGTRLRCTTCGSEGIVVKPGDAEFECCGAPLEATFISPSGEGTESNNAS